MIYENPLPYRTRWIEKMVPFNFTIHYWPEIKMDYIDFTSRMDTFLPKNSTSISTSTLRAQKQSDYN